MLPTATGRRSRSYDPIRRVRTSSGSIDEDDEVEVFSPDFTDFIAFAVAILHANACASCTPVFIPNPPAGGNLCAASPHSTTLPFPVTKESATSADIVHDRTLLTSKSPNPSPFVPLPHAARSISALSTSGEKSFSRLWCGGKNGTCATNSPVLKSCATTTATTSGLKTKYNIAARPSFRSLLANSLDVKCTLTRCCMAGVPVIGMFTNCRTVESAPSAATICSHATRTVESVGSDARTNPLLSNTAVTPPLVSDVPPRSMLSRFALVMNPSRPRGCSAYARCSSAGTSLCCPKCATDAGLIDDESVRSPSTEPTRRGFDSSVGPSWKWSTRPSSTPPTMLVQYTNRRQSSSGGCDRAMDPPSPMSGRKISMLRLLTKCACGCIVGLARRSHTRWSIPNRDSSAERVRPVGPAPTMSTGTETSAGDEASSARDDEVDARVDADTSYGQLGRGAGEPSRGLVRGRDPRCARDRTSRLIDPASPRAPYCVRRYVVTTRFCIFQRDSGNSISRGRTRRLCSTSSCFPTAPSCCRPSPCPSSSCWRCADPRPCAA